MTVSPGEQIQKVKKSHTSSSITTILFFTGIVLIILLAGAAFIFSKNQTRKQTFNSQNNTVIPSPTPIQNTISAHSEIITSGTTSQQYTNHEYMFSINVPKSLVLTESAFSPTTTLVELRQKTTM